MKIKNKSSKLLIYSFVILFLIIGSQFYFINPALAENSSYKPHFNNKNVYVKEYTFVRLEILNLTLEEYYIIFYASYNFTFRASTYNDYETLQTNQIKNNSITFSLYAFNSTFFQKGIFYDSIVVNLHPPITQHYTPRDYLFSFVAILIILFSIYYWRKYY